MGLIRGHLNKVAWDPDMWHPLSLAAQQRARTLSPPEERMCLLLGKARVGIWAASSLCALTPLVSPSDSPAPKRDAHTLARQCRGRVPNPLTGSASMVVGVSF